MINMMFGQQEQEMEFMPIVPLGEEELNDEEKGNTAQSLQNTDKHSLGHG